MTGEDPCKSIMVYGHEAARNYLGLYTLRENKVKGFWSYISPDGDYIIRVNDDLDEWIVEQMDFGRVEGGRRFKYKLLSFIHTKYSTFKNMVNYSMLQKHFN